MFKKPVFFLFILIFSLSLAEDNTFNYLKDKKANDSSVSSCSTDLIHLSLSKKDFNEKINGYEKDIEITVKCSNEQQSWIISPTTLYVNLINDNKIIDIGYMSIINNIEHSSNSVEKTKSFIIGKGTKTVNAKLLVGKNILPDKDDLIQLPYGIFDFDFSIDETIDTSILY